MKVEMKPRVVNWRLIWAHTRSLIPCLQCVENIILLTVLYLLSCGWSQRTAWVVCASQRS